MWKWILGAAILLAVIILCIFILRKNAEAKHRKPTRFEKHVDKRVSRVPDEDFTTLVRYLVSNRKNVHVKITGRGIRLFTDFTHEHPEYPGHRFTLSEKVYLLWGCVKPDFYETDMGTYVGHYCSPQLRSKDGRTTNTAYTNFEMHYVNSVYSYAAGSRRKALVELGMAMHYMEDINSPPHAALISGEPHHSFETWTRRNWRREFLLDKAEVGDVEYMIDSRIRGICVNFSTLASNAAEDCVRFHSVEKTAECLHRCQWGVVGLLCRFTLHAGYESSDVEGDLDGTVIGTEDLGVDGGALQAVRQPVGDAEVVDAPPGILFPGFEPVGPPGVNAFRIGVEVPEGVGESGVQKIGEFAPLFVGESGVFPVGLGVFQIDLLMGDVQVPAEDHGLLFVQPLQVFPEGVFPAHPVVQTGQFVLGVGGVAGHQIEVFIFQGDDPAFVVVFFHSDAVSRAERFFFCENGGAGVAFFLGVVPVLAVAGEVQVDLAFLEFGFLEAEEVGVGFGEVVQEAFPDAGAEAVDVP